MKTNPVLFRCAVLICSALLTACATTELTFVWKNDKYTGGPVRSIAVVGLSQKPAVRDLFEDEFVRELKAHGVDAVPSYTVLLSHELADRELAIAKIKTLDTDSVLATRLLNRKMVQTYAPTVYTFPNYYWDRPGYYGYAITGGQVTLDEEVVLLETNLYDVKTGQLLWTARTDTWLADAQQTLVRGFAKTIIDKMIADRVIR